MLSSLRLENFSFSAVWSKRKWSSHSSVLKNNSFIIHSLRKNVPTTAARIAAEEMHDRAFKTRANMWGRAWKLSTVWSVTNRTAVIKAGSQTAPQPQRRNPQTMFTWKSTSARVGSSSALSLFAMTYAKQKPVWRGNLDHMTLNFSRALSLTPPQGAFQWDSRDHVTNTLCHWVPVLTCSLIFFLLLADF